MRFVAPESQLCYSLLITKTQNTKRVARSGTYAPLKRRTIAIVVLVYILIYCFMFREFFGLFSAMMRGDMVVSADELVPFFNPHSQFWDQVKGGFNDLTHGLEFRVRYSIMTTWMRYYKVLPYALIIAPILTSLLMTFALYKFLRGLVKTTISSERLLRGCALTSLLFHFILLFTKVTHFYTLVVGYVMFLCSVLLLLWGVFFERKKPFHYMLGASLLAFINPAIHYILLYAIVTSIVFVITFLLHRWFEVQLYGSKKMQKVPWYYIWKKVGRGKQQEILYPMLARGVIAFGFLACCTIIPYALLVKFFFLRGIENIGDTVPANYHFIQSASVPLLHQLSLDLAGIMDNFLQGNYLLPQARYSNMAYFCTALLLLTKPVREALLPKQYHRAFVTTIFILLGLSMWFCLGYSLPPFVPTFHRSLGWIVTALYDVHNVVADIIIMIIANVIQVLRFPHRFQFISFAAVCISLPIGIVYLESRADSAIKKAKKFRGKKLVQKNIALLVIFTFFVPLFSNWEYREVLSSGNFSEFLSPYDLSRIREIKQMLNVLPPGKTVMIPPTETSKRITDARGNTHKFIDKFPIYYLDKPSYYYGLTGDMNNKQEFFLMYRALHYEQDWWFNILRDKDVRYIIVNKEIGPNFTGGMEYLRGIERATQRQADRADFYLKKRYENAGFILYELVDEREEQTQKILLDVDWNSFICYQNNFMRAGKHFDLMHKMTEIDLESEPVTLITSDPRKSALDAFFKKNPIHFYRPLAYNFYFEEKIIPSTFYFGIIFSMFNLFGGGKYNYMNMLMPGTYDTLTGTFIGLPGKTKLRFKVKIPDDGTYYLVMRSVTTRNRLDFQLGNGEHVEFIADEDSRTHASLYDEETLFTSNRQVVDTRQFSIEELEERIPEEIMPVSHQFNYVPIMTVNNQKGSHWLYMNKLDANPMAIEGIAVLSEQDLNENIFDHEHLLFIHKSKFKFEDLIQEDE